MPSFSSADELGSCRLARRSERRPLLAPDRRGVQGSRGAAGGVGGVGGVGSVGGSFGARRVESEHAKLYEMLDAQARQHYLSPLIPRG